jgi:hypothetical protein
MEIKYIARRSKMENLYRPPADKTASFPVPRPNPQFLATGPRIIRPLFPTRSAKREIKVAGRPLFSINLQPATIN